MNFNLFVDRFRAFFDVREAEKANLSHDVAIAFRSESSFYLSFNFSDTAIAICKYWELFLRRFDVKNLGKRSKAK